MTVTELRTRKVFPDGHSAACTSVCLTEKRLRVFINGKLRYTLVCTGDDIEQLIAGRLCTDSVCRYGEIERISCPEGSDTVHVTLRTQTADAEPVCCDTIHAPAVQRVLHPLPPFMPDSRTIFDIIALFETDSRLHRTTGGTHRCILYYDTDTPESAAFEDISRHNAVDKAVGHALMRSFALPRCILFTSGRVPVDMAEKVIAAGIPVLISKSVPTAEAVRLAEQYHLTLICRAWRDSFEIFSAWQENKGD